MKRLFPLCIILCLSATAHAAPKTILKAETAKFSSTAGGAEISGYYYRPAGDGPFPVIVGMHGCGGLFESNRKTILDTRIDWAERFVKAGYLLIYPHSYGSRGLGSVCEIKPAELKVRLPEQVGDLAGAVNWLLTQPFVDKNRIALMGWGTGGTAAMRILDPAYPIHKRATFAVSIAFYPQCEFLLRSTNYSPLILPMIQAGASDELAPAKPCSELSKRWASPITLHPRSYHNFDAPNAPVRKRKYASGVVYVGTNTEARNKSIKETMEMLKKSFAVVPEKTGTPAPTAENTGGASAR